MKILRYVYANWTVGFDDVNEPTQNAGFDFSLSRVVEHLHSKQNEQESGLHISASRRATYTATLQLLEWTQNQVENRENIALWYHASRDWSLEEWQHQNRLWLQASRKISRQNSQNDLPYFAHMEDEFFGQYLSELIYKRDFISCFCPACQIRYEAQHCCMEQWIAHSSGGEKCVCARQHTLHSRETMEFFASIHED